MDCKCGCGVAVRGTWSPGHNRRGATDYKHSPAAIARLTAGLKKAYAEGRRQPMAGENHPLWRGGVTMKSGRRWLHRPAHPHATKDGYVQESRLVMERWLGRYLEPQEVVGHEDRDKLNNVIGNLVLFSSQSTHMKSHWSRM